MADNGGVLIRRAGGTWSSPEVASYDDEAHLQQVISRDPQQVPGVSQDSLTVKELPTSGGWIDVCIVGMDGSITVVECKLASNPEKRRMVVGQVIDYAAAIWKDGADTFLDSWRRHPERPTEDLVDVLEPAALAQLRHNIADGRIDLCLAVDLIDDDLRRLIEYLNNATRSDVMVTALQLAYARDGDVEILSPSTYGGELAAAKVRTSSRSTERWTWESFLAALASEDDRRLADELHSRLDQLDGRRGSRELLWFGSKPGGGVFLHPYGLRYAPFQLWVNSAGHLMAYGNWRQYSAVAAHPAFAPLGGVLGQDHHGGSQGVRVGDLDIDRLWASAVECAVGINE